MSNVRPLPGGYGFIVGVFQHSAGVAAQPGFTLERARFRTVMPLSQAFTVRDLDYEMDVRGVSREIVLEPAGQ